MMRYVIARAYPQLVLRSRRCSSSTSSSPSVDRSLTSKHVATDGRVFHFATVVVNKMGKGQSALFAWHHACSLVKANPPTLAIAFISRPTDSALAAISDLANQFSSCHEHGGRPNLPFRTQQMASYTRSGDGLTDAARFAGDRVPSLYSHEINATATSACSLPKRQTHDSASNSASQLINSPMIPSSTALLASTPAVTYENTCTCGPQSESTLPLIGCIITDQRRAPSRTSIIRANLEMTDDIFWLDASEEKGGDFNVGGTTGFGGFGSSNDNSAIVEGSPGSGEGASHCGMQSSNEPNMEMLSEKTPIEEEWAPFNCSFAIQFNEPNSPRSRNINELENVMGRQCQEQPVVQDGFSEHAVNVRGFGQQGKLFCAKKVACEGEVSGRGILKALSQPMNVDKAHKDSKRTCNGQEQGKEEEETYMLSLCVANMPAVRATGFYTRTSRLPWLPDLGTTVTTSHPHMVLLGAPGV
ncbi:hypothetical protein L7F22_042777 [Adiantum nelumboides]|nr:hypothetical protein [Adiantum nelumboides]